MSFQSKKPPIRLVINTNKFNKLVGILDSLNIENDELKTKLDKLKNKIMTYSAVRTEEETNNPVVDIRFFPNETIDLIVLFLESVNIDSDNNYYEELVKSKNLQN